MHRARPDHGFDADHVTSADPQHSRTALTPWRRLWNAAHVLLAVVALLWAGNAIVGRAVRDDIPPFTLAFGRWAGALILLAPFAWRQCRADWPVLRRHWKVTLLLGLVGAGAFNALLYSGLQYTTATNAVLIQALIPPLLLLLAFLFFGERTNAPRIVAASLSTLGVGIIVLDGDLGALRTLDLGRGDALVLIGVFAWSAYTLLLRRRPPVHPSSFLAATFLIGGLAMLPLSVIEHLHGDTVRWSEDALMAFAYVATLPSLLAYLLYNRGVELIGPARAGQFLNLMPLFGAGLAVLLLGEPFGTHHLIGVTLILLGIIGFSRGSPGSPLPP